MGVVGVVTVLFASIVMHWLGPTCSRELGGGVLTISQFPKHLAEGLEGTFLVQSEMSIFFPLNFISLGQLSFDEKLLKGFSTVQECIQLRNWKHKAWSLSKHSYLFGESCTRW